MDASSHLLETIRFEFTRLKTLAEKAMDQLSDNQWKQVPGTDCNSCAIIVQHISGNLLSRWTDFLTSDGEKSWRNRDAEFEAQNLSRTEQMKLWQQGWKTLFIAIDPLSPDQLLQTVTIRNEGLTVAQALLLQVSHYSYHIGQIVFVAHLLKGEHWRSLSIPKNQSASAKGAYLKP
jgi:uncharacterized damage-inducible protein DinB